MTPSQSTGSQAKIFIGSTKEAFEVAKAVRAALFYEADGIVWTDRDVFEVGEVPIESLEKILTEVPFAIFVMSPEDTVISRKHKSRAPRDNLIFELGLWAGRHGRRSVFMIVPFGEKVRLPSDLAGITVGEYKIRKNGETTTYEVSTACDAILSVIKKSQNESEQSQSFKPLKFWDILSETVVIVYGVDPSKSTVAERHPRISLRDLESAYEISHFLARQYPRKSIVPVAAGTPGWEHLLQADVSLVIIGGFVTNRAYASYRSQLGRRYSLRMGRLCGIEKQLRGVKEQRVFHIKFKGVAGSESPPREDPQALEDAPSEFISHDFGLVTSRNSIVAGKQRRVVTIAGIKGYGNLGATKALTGNTDQRVNLNEILSSPLTKSDEVEIIVATDVGDNRIDRTEVIEVVLNDQRIFRAKEQRWEPCELQRPCEDCTFGLPASLLNP